MQYEVVEKLGGPHREFYNSLPDYARAVHQQLIFSRFYLFYCILSLMLAVGGGALLLSHGSIEQAFDDELYFSIEVFLTSCILVEIMIGCLLCGQHIWQVSGYHIDGSIAAISLTTILLDEVVGYEILPYHEEDYVRIGCLIARQVAALFRLGKFGRDMVQMRNQHIAVQQTEISLPFDDISMVEHHTI